MSWFGIADLSISDDCNILDNRGYSNIGNSYQRNFSENVPAIILYIIITNLKIKNRENLYFK